MGIYSAACTLDFGYIHRKIKHIEQNPGDPNTTEEQRIDYLHRVNDLFELPGTTALTPTFSIRLSKFSPKTVRRLRVLDRIARRLGFAIQVVLPYSLPWSDLFPNSYDNAAKIIRPRIPATEVGREVRVDMHIRRALAPELGRNGTTYDRYVSTDWYRQVAIQIMNVMSECNLRPRFVIHTDIPRARWKVPLDTTEGTLSMWNHHRLVDAEGFLFEVSENLEEQFGFLDKFEIAREWDALDVIHSMATATILVTYASSLSYVAGLLRGKNLTVSPEFFHKTPSSWCTLSAILNSEEREKLDLRIREAIERTQEPENLH